MTTTAHTPGALTTVPDNTIHLGLPMGGSGAFRVVWSEQTGRDVAYVLPPPTTTDEEGEVHDVQLDDAAELVRRWNAFPAMLAACLEAEAILAKLDTLRHLAPEFSGLDRLRAAIAAATSTETAT